MIAGKRSSTTAGGKLTISVFGLGYVGSVSAACCAEQGHRIIGVDPQQAKVDLINEGVPPVVERDLAELIREVRRDGRLSATSDAAAAISESSISFISVGTPSRQNGSLDLSSLARVCEEIGAALRDKRDFHIVVVRSTVLPGTLQKMVLPILERTSSKRAGIDFGVVSNPEFLREGTAVDDFRHPPKTVIGAFDECTGGQVAQLYEHLDAPLICTSVEIAELIKYVDNAWHALKVTFGNEVGNACKALGIDSHQVMDLFCRDTQLNLSSYYLKPGFAFGGSCLPKDLRAFIYHARSLDLSLPMLESILPSNRLQIDRAIRLITSKGRRRIGVLGFSFKAGTDDLRESPMVEVIETLIGKGYELKLYDAYVNLARLIGANREYLLRAIPHIVQLMAGTIDEVLASSDLILVGNNDPAYWGIAGRLAPHQTVLDMVRLPNRDGFSEHYDGINW
jgi:GDP-mannose 6-dehydrogenase